MKKILIGLILGLMTQPLLAQDQEPLDLEKAIQQGLENNFQVKIAVETISLRQGEIGLGWSAFFPVVDAIYTRNFANEDVTQTFVSDPETPREILGAKSRSENFTVAAIYGFRPEAVVAVKRLGQLAEISELDAKVAVEIPWQRFLQPIIDWFWSFSVMKFWSERSNSVRQDWILRKPNMNWVEQEKEIF